TNTVALATDPRFRHRTMPLVKFIAGMQLYISHECLRTMPSFIVVAPGGALEEMDRDRATVDIFWQAERISAGGGVAILRIAQTDVALGFGPSLSTAADDERGGCHLAMASIQEFLGIEQNREESTPVPIRPVAIRPMSVPAIDGSGILHR